ncbi:hypothetical protein [Phormidium nigroviride]
MSLQAKLSDRKVLGLLRCDAFGRRSHRNHKEYVFPLYAGCE